MTWGVPLGPNNITNAYLVTKSILKAFDNEEIKSQGIWLEFLDIGNEPNLYNKNGLRAENYTVADYVDEYVDMCLASMYLRIASRWTEFAANLSVAAGLFNGEKTKFLIAS